MKRKLLTLACMAALALGIPSAANAAKMSLTLTDGKTIEIELKDRMNAAFWVNPADPAYTYYYSVYTGECTVDAAGEFSPVLDESGNPKGEVYLTAKVTESKDIHFSGVTGIDAPSAADMEYSFSDGVLRINGDGSYTVSSYSTAGSLEGSERITAPGEFDVTRFGAGIHVISINGVSFKVLVK